MEKFNQTIAAYIIKKGIEYRTQLSKTELKEWVFVCSMFFNPDGINTALNVIDKFFVNHEYGYMPKIEQFKKFLQNGAMLDDELDIVSYDAWNTALDTAVLYGNVPVDFEDKLINVAVRKLGGWSNFHNSVAYSINDNDIQRRNDMQKKFLSIYRKLYKTKYFKIDETKPLTGYINDNIHYISCDSAVNSNLIIEFKKREYNMLSDRDNDDKTVKSKKIKKILKVKRF